MANILIVDDDRSIRTNLALFIESLGHRAEAVGDGGAALERLSRVPFDIVLSDVRMPGIGGLALLRELRHRQIEVPVVFMTAYAEVPQAVEAMRLGAYEYLMKPFSPDDIRLLIARILEGRNTPLAVSSPEPDTTGGEGEALSLRELERRRIEEVLARSVTLEEAATRLGINPSTLWRKRRRYGLENLGPTSTGSARWRKSAKDER